MLRISVRLALAFGCLWALAASARAQSPAPIGLSVDASDAPDGSSTSANR